MGQFLLTMMTMMMCGLVVSGHINNLYNTTFWALQQKGGMSATEAEKELKVNQVYISFPSPSVSFYFLRLGKRSWG